MAGTDWTGLSAFVTSLSLFVTSVGGLVLRFVFRGEQGRTDDDDDGNESIEIVNGAEDKLLEILQARKEKKTRRHRRADFTARIIHAWRLI